MTAKETIEQRLKELGQAISPDETLIENVMSRIEAEPDYNKKKILVRRFIMNRLTKLAAAAVIIIAVTLSSCK